MYCNPEELRDEIAQAQKTGVISDRLVHLVGLIAAGVRSRLFPWTEREDFVQEGILLFLERYRQCDVKRPASEVFNWTTTVVSNEAKQNERSVQNYRKKLREFAAHLGEDIPKD